MSPLAESFSCQDYSEQDSVSECLHLVSNLPTDWVFQLKFDGIWAKIVLDSKGTASVYSKTGQLKTAFRYDTHLLSFKRGETVLIAEYMYGSQWAKKEGREGLLYVFDCLVFDGQDISTFEYSRRKQFADSVATELGGRFKTIASYATSKLGQVWLQLEKERSYEGIVLRRLSSTWFTTLYKLKLEVEDDYVILGGYAGEGKHEGRLGGFHAAQYKNGTLTEIMRVGGGFSDAQREEFWKNLHSYTGKVMLVQGKSRFDSGALRHPNFVRIRDDKRPEDCILK